MSPRGILIMVGAMLFFSSAIRADTTSYAFVTSTDGAFTDMSSGTQQLIGPAIDDASSQYADIGFDFYFGGARWTRFVVNSNGYLGLNGGAPANLYSLGTRGGYFITAFGSDLSTSDAGKIHYKVTGSAPNRILTVEFANMTIINNPGVRTADGTYQLRLYETSGAIEFVYGPMRRNGGTGSSGGMNPQYIGFSTFYGNIAGTFATVDMAHNENTAGMPVANQFPLNTSMAGLDSPIDGARRVYRFSPSIPTAPSNLTFSDITPLSMTLNWTDAPNEGRYAAYLSTNGVDYSFFQALSQNTTSLAISDLEVKHTYFWRIYAISDGAQSAPLEGSQTTPAGKSISSSAAGGLWSSPVTWEGRVVPTSSDDVTVVDGANITIDTDASALSLTIGTGGATTTLGWDATAARKLSVGTSVTIPSNGVFKSAVTGIVTNHLLSVGGDLTNNGILDFSTNNNAAGADIIFTGARNNTFGGSGLTTDVRSITLNKGISSSNILELMPANFTVRGTTTDGAQMAFAAITNGTLKISGTFNMTARVFIVAQFVGAIPVSAGFWLNNPNFTVTGQPLGLFGHGLLGISQGTLNVGVAANDLLYTRSFLIEGGTLNVTGPIYVDGPVIYTQTGGVVNVCTIGNTFTSAASFGFTSPDTVFNMSGGTINLVQICSANQLTDRLDYQVAGTANITGGTLNVGTGATVGAGNFDFRLRGSVPNLVIDNSGHPKNALFTAPVTSHANVTINPGCTLNTQGNAWIARGPNITNNGAILVPTNGGRLSFQGTGAQFYSGNGTAAIATTAGSVDLSVDNPAGLTIDPASNGIVTQRVNFFRGGITNANKLTLGNGSATASVVQYGGSAIADTAGNFDVAPSFNLGTGGEIVAYGPEIASRSTAAEIPASRTIGSLVVNNQNGAIIAGGDLTLSNTGVALNLTNGRLETGTNTLVLSSGTATVNRVGGQVNGNLTKVFNNAGAKTFEVGDGTIYAPVTVNVTNGTFPSNVTLSTTGTREPHYSGFLSALQRYWTINASNPVTSDLIFQYVPADVVGFEPAYHTISYQHLDPFTDAFVDYGTVDAAHHRGLANGITNIRGNWTLMEADNDFDGMPNSYENTYGLDENGADADLDLDGDGTTNFAEYLAGTNPQIGNSVLRITAITRDILGQTFVTFDAIAGKTYRLEFNTALISAGWMPVPTSDLTASSSGSQQFIDVTASSEPRFYRVSVVLR